ncbi:MAG: UDP-glucose/GDP-mannose dehydrogenase family protein, partial [Alphaproteobacteria bacterium]|nr:UDP-glucose/GDP-mannose dehydrogenase family protein [Alphaproteobacteria bacterium]
MRITIIGSGYVGLVTGACFAEFGFKVTSVDNDENKIANLVKGQIPIYEPGLESLVRHNQTTGRLGFTTDLKTSVREADVVMIAVGTPARRGDGFADLSYVFKATEEIAESLNGYTVVVTKSTVPVGTCRKVAEIIEQKRPDLKRGTHFDVASNPEFLREGSAISDFMRPDRVVVGTDSNTAKEVLAKLYRPLYLIETPIVFTSIETSELIKYASNGFLAMKIAFINQMADLCEKAGADVQDLAKGIGLDGRIGRKFLNAGPGYGGSCFPKDTLALSKTAHDLGSPVTLIDAVVSSNDARKKAMAKKVLDELEKRGSVSGKTVAVLGITFKPNTDDLRDAPSLV